MPQTAAFIDAMRDAFGREHIDGQIRRGIAGDATFHAAEAGHELGTARRPGDRVATTDMVLGEPGSKGK